MHYHLEVVMPPTEDVEPAVESILGRFKSDDNYDPDEGWGYPFWDFYVIGGRFAGNKRLARYSKKLIDEFYQWLRDSHVTVAGIQCGKQELKPASQIAVVDAKWNSMFPADDTCPIFAHSNDQYGRDGSGTLPDDVMRFDSVPELECNHVIFAGPSYDAKQNKRCGPLEAVFMLMESAWNGVNHMPIKWDGTFADAVAQFEKRLENMSAGYRDVMTPREDWLVVTVDYHN